MMCGKGVSRMSMKDPKHVAGGTLNWFVCRAEEWALCKFFTYLYRVDRGLSASIRGLDRSSLKKGALLVLFMFAAGYAGYYGLSAFAPWHNVFAVLPILALPVFLFRLFYLDQMKHEQKLKRAARQVSRQEAVPYICLNREGIGVNMLGNPDLKQLPFIRWDSLRKIELHYTAHPFRIGAPENKFKFRERMEVYFDEMRREYPDFEDEPRDEYEDRFSLLLTHHPANLTQIALPVSWIHSGELKQLVEQVEAASGMKVQPYPYLGQKRERMHMDYCRVTRRLV